MLHTGGDALISYTALWDGRSVHSDGPGVLKISSGKIISVRSADGTLPVWDFAGLTIMPALIDCHLHLTLPDCGMAAAAAGLLTSGIATVRDAGAKEQVAFSLSPLRVVSTGQAISRVNFYGSHLSMPVGSVPEALELVDLLASRGVEQVKVITSDFRFPTTEFCCGLPRGGS